MTPSFWPLCLLVVNRFALTYSALTTYTDWQAALGALIDLKTKWEASGVTEYAYHWRPSCFCEPCWSASKYIVIEQGLPTYVEFDPEFPATSWDGSTCDPAQYIQSPLSDTFHDLTYYLERAIAHAKRGVDAQCPIDSPKTSAECWTGTSQPADAICGGSLTIGYDDVLFAPTQLSLNYGPCIADAGMSYTFSCLTVFDHVGAVDLTAYRGECARFERPMPGGTCTGCLHPRCACSECPNGSGLQFGCCGQCTWEPNAQNELVCQGVSPQDRVCDAAQPVAITTCGGFANCARYSDGCNECSCRGGSVLDACTRRMCFWQGSPSCLECEPGYMRSSVTGQCRPAPTIEPWLMPNPQPIFLPPVPMPSTMPPQLSKDCGGIPNCQSYKPDSCNVCSCSTGGNFPMCTMAFCPVTSEYPQCTACREGYELDGAGGCVESAIPIDPVGCMCPMHYDPVCCDEGQFGNSCVAGCERATNCRSGACASVKPEPTLPIAPKCGGFEHCDAYFDGCNTCRCSAGGFDACTRCILPITVDLAALKRCTTCKAGYEVDPLTGKCVVDATQCCAPMSNALLCREGCACCPGGTWAVSIGDGRTFSCNGETLVLGVDEFSAECSAEATKVSCDIASDCDAAQDFLCRVDPECAGSTLECLERKVCMNVDTPCESDLDCAAGFACVARNSRSMYCVQYQS